MSIHSFNRWFRHTFDIQDQEQLVDAQRLVTEFLEVLHHYFVVSGRDHVSFFSALSGCMREGAECLAVALSLRAHVSSTQDLWAANAGFFISKANKDGVLFEALSRALTDVYFGQLIFPVLTCDYALGVFLRDMMECCSGHYEAKGNAPYLLYYVIGAKAAYHWICLLPEEQRTEVLEELDFFPEQVESFDSAVRGWENESIQT